MPQSHGSGLENRRARKGSEGSNPSPSAKIKSLIGDGPLRIRRRKRYQGDLPTAQESAQAMTPAPPEFVAAIRAQINSADENGVTRWLSAALMEWVRVARVDPKRSTRGFTLTFEDLYKVASDQKSRCALSGIEFEQRYNVGRNPFGFSVDRIDHKRGYHADNVRLVCVIVNIARNNFSDAELVRMARAIVDHEDRNGYSLRCYHAEPER